jgi:hypothetical protein
MSKQNSSRKDNQPSNDTSQDNLSTKTKSVAQLLLL